MRPAATAQHRWYANEGLRLHALAFAGEPPTIVCLHGVGGHAWSWLPFSAAIGTEARCLAIDLRGHGDSQWSPSGDYSTASHSRDVEAVLDAAGASDVTFVGTSWGGLVGLVLAARRPDLVARLVMVDLGPSSAKSPDDVPERPSSFVTHDEVVAYERERDPRAEAATWELLAHHGTRPGEHGLLLPKHDPVFARSWVFRTEDHWAALKALERPLLVVKASDSPVLPEAVAERMVAEARDARLAIVPESGHVVNVENPTALARLVRSFIPG